MMQQLILLGTFFVLPVYLQMVLGLDAFETGKRLFPMSVTMFVAAMLAPGSPPTSRPSAWPRPGWRARRRVDPAARHDRRGAQRHRSSRSRCAVRDRRRPAALAARQRDHVLRRPDQTNEAGGLQGTAQNLGASLGTALIGSVLIAALTSGFVSRVEENPDIPAGGRATASLRCARRASRSSRWTRSSRRRLDAGVPGKAQAVADDYGEAQLQASSARSAPSACSRCSPLWFTRAASRRGRCLHGPARSAPRER